MYPMFTLLQQAYTKNTFFFNLFGQKTLHLGKTSKISLIKKENKLEL